MAIKSPTTTVHGNLRSLEDVRNGLTGAHIVDHRERTLLKKNPGALFLSGASRNCFECLWSIVASQYSVHFLMKGSSIWAFLYPQGVYSGYWVVCSFFGLSVCFFIACCAHVGFYQASLTLVVFYQGRWACLLLSLPWSIWFYARLWPWLLPVSHI